jgi:hypothetical protein
MACAELMHQCQGLHHAVRPLQLRGQQPEHKRATFSVAPSGTPVNAALRSVTGKRAANEDAAVYRLDLLIDGGPEEIQPTFNVEALPTPSASERQRQYHRSGKDAALPRLDYAAVFDGEWLV